MKLRILVAAGFAVALSTAAHAEDVKFDLVNKSSYQIDEFYASPATTDDWEEDILGSSVIPPGASVDINFDDGTGSCMFDFKAVFADGSTAVEQGINVCTTSGVTVS